jgi:hypothetical protein
MKMYAPDPTDFRSTGRRAVILAGLSALATFSVASLTLMGWAWLRYGSPKAGLEMLAGQSLLIEPSVCTVGLVPAGQVRTLRVRVSNMTGREIPILGLGDYCGRNGCVEGEDQYPLIIGPRGSRELAIRIRGPGEPGRSFELTAELYSGVGTRAIVIIGRS